MAFPPRYVPTLTEVVLPQAADFRQTPQTALFEAAPIADSGSLRSPHVLHNIDSDALVQAVIDELTPQMHLHLRNSAHELLEMQLREVLPALQMSLEAEVRRSVEAALAQRQLDKLV